MRKILLIFVMIVFAVSMTACTPTRTSSYSTTKSSKVKHPCSICGKTDGTRQITAKAANGQWDDGWYCDKHYADAWQYYYG